MRIRRLKFSGNSEGKYFSVLRALGVGRKEEENERKKIKERTCSTRVAHSF